MKVLDADSGSSLKAKMACWAATKALLVLMVKSRLKSANGRESGSFGSFRVAAAALKASAHFGNVFKYRKGYYHCTRQRLEDRAVISLWRKF